MKKLTTFGIALAASLSLNVVADENVSSKAKEQSNPHVISAQDLKAVPELESNDLRSLASAAPRMKCLVDTPAWDRWGYAGCFSVGNARSTTAFFQIENMPSSFTVYWSDSRCSTSSSSCSLPIYQYNSITLNATVLNHSNNTFTTTSSTAHYEGFN